MAIIPLRAYNREIEGMIDNGQLDEAVAHCRHILATFPKHIASYRLLGKTHLEQQRISDATDIFQRVLSAIPDDFISNVGMSIIREDENNLDAAIWHMELAYEAQPANLAIKDELRRLYGRRDGMQPPGVRITRGALARMYAKGGLFDQAVAELRAAITEDPNRPDLQLLLAQMLYQTSQRVDAVDTCVNILKKMPLCLEANRILAVSLPDAENSEVVKNSRQLVISMDPYYAFAEPEAISSDQVPDNAVNIERLEYKSGIQVGEVPEQPAWATSLGISMEKPAEDNMPEWLKAVEAPSAVPPADNVSPGVSPFIWDTQEVENIITDTSKPEGELPDWMKDAGWAPATAASQAQPPELTPVEDQNPAAPVGDDLVQADIPEWLRGIAPDGFSGTQGQQLQADDPKITNPWLQPHQPGPTDSIIQWLDEEKPIIPAAAAAQKANIVLPPEDEVPDWLKDLDIPQPEEQGGPGIAVPAAAFTAGLAAFLDDADKPDQPQPVPAAEEPQPLSQEPPAPAESIPPAEVAAVEAAALPAAEDELPDWLKDISSEEPPSEMPVIPAAAVVEQAFKSEPEPPVEDAAVPAEAQPDSKLPEIAGAFMAAEMLSKSTEEPVAEQPETETQPGETIPPVMAAAAAGISEAVPPPAIEAEIMPAEQEILNEPEAFAWLKGLEDEQGTEAEPELTPSPEGEIPPPEWVNLETEPSAESPTEPAEEMPEWIKGLGEDAETEGIGAEQVPAGTSEEPLEWETEELPAWLKEITESEPQPAPEASHADELAAAALVSSLAHDDNTPGTVEAEKPQAPDLEVAPVAVLAAEQLQLETPSTGQVETETVAEAEETPSAHEEFQPSIVEESAEPSQEMAAKSTLANARSAITNGDTSQAVSHYSSLIKQKFHLEDVIKDLHEALDRNPVDTDMWVTLGDAHSQTSDLQEALNAYTKAEESVR